ncbi:MAG: right-handed parallel beta-helix repeat-containing protein [Anaerolineae bacterium]
MISDSIERGIYAEDVHLDMRNTTLSNNGNDGLWLYGKTTPLEPVLRNNIFSNNGRYAAYLLFNRGCEPGTDMQNNTGSGNGWINGIYVEGYVYTPEVCHWGPNPNLPYVLWTVVVGEEGHLAIDPGTVVKFVNPDLERSTGTLIISGTLEATGTATSPVAFTSFWDDDLGGDTDGTDEPPVPGDWLGIVLQTGADVTLDQAIVRYGGANGTNLFAENASLSLTNSEISFSQNKGLGIRATVPTAHYAIQNNTFDHNEKYAATLYCEVPGAATFDFYGTNGTGNGTNALRHPIADSCRGGHPHRQAGRGHQGRPGTLQGRQPDQHWRNHGGCGHCPRARHLYLDPGRPGGRRHPR